jgi:hypothetical protein
MKDDGGRFAPCGIRTATLHEGHYGGTAVVRMEGFLRQAGWCASGEEKTRVTAAKKNDDDG